MAVAEQITRIQTAKENIKSSLSAKGVEVGDAKLDEYSTFIDEMQVGGDVSEYFAETITYGETSRPGVLNIIKNISENITITGNSCAYMFYNARGLETIPLIDTSKITNMNYMFGYCKSLKTIPLINTSSLVNASYMFAFCDLLEQIPLLDTSNVSTMATMFKGCISLTEVPQFNTSKVKTMTSVFDGCTSLVTVPELEASAMTTVYGLFVDCSTLTNLGGLKNLGKAYSKTTAANNSNYKLDLSTCKSLTHDSLMNVINNLYDIATAGCNTQQLVLGSTNLAKLTDEEKLIAQNKGWTLS